MRSDRHIGRRCRNMNGPNAPCWYPLVACHGAWRNCAEVGHSLARLGNRSPVPRRRCGCYDQRIGLSRRYHADRTHTRSCRTPRRQRS